MKKLVVLLVLIAGIWACNKDSDSSIPDTTAYINVFIANPDGSYDVVLDTATLGKGLTLGQYTDYKSFTAKRYNLYFFASGNRTDTLIQGQISLRNKHHYSVFFEKNHNGVLQLLATEDQVSTNSKTAGYLRVVNLSDTYLSTGAAMVLNFNVDSTKTFTNIGYLGASVFKEITPGAHKLDIRSVSDSVSRLYSNSSGFTIEAGKSYSFIAYGNALKSDSFKVVTLQHN